MKLLFEIKKNVNNTLKLDKNLGYISLILRDDNGAKRMQDGLGLIHKNLTRSSHITTFFIFSSPLPALHKPTHELAPYKFLNIYPF